MRHRRASPRRGVVPLVALALVCGLGGCGGVGAAGKTAPAAPAGGRVGPHPPTSAKATPITHPPRPSAPPVNQMPPPTGLYWATTTTGYLSAQETLYRTTDGGTAWTAWYHGSQPITTVAGSGATSLWLAAGPSLRDLGATGHVIRIVALPGAGSVEQLALPSPGIAYLRRGGAPLRGGRDDGVLAQRVRCPGVGHRDGLAVAA